MTRGSLWTDGSPGSGLYPSFSPQEFARRHAATRAMMAREALDALVVYGESSLNRHGQADTLWLSGFFGHRSTYVVLSETGEPVLFVQPHNHVPNAREMAILEVRDGGMDVASAVALHVRDMHGRAGVCGYVGPVPVQDWACWQQMLPDWRFRDVTDAFRRLRLVKSSEELIWVRRGAELTDRAVETLLEGLRPGMCELDAAALIENTARTLGGLPHVVYLSSTPQDAPAACVPRPCPSLRTIAPGDVVNFEVSVSYWGYSGQMHRPVFVRVGPNALYGRLWDVALEAYERCVALLRPGATVEDVLNAAEWIHQEGFTIKDAFLHGFVVGLLPPSVRTRRTTTRPQEPFVFEAGMCVVVQPNVVTPDERAGVQVGNLFLITSTGAECLHRVPVQYFVV